MTNFKQKFTIRNLLLISISLTCVFTVRALIIHLLNLDLSLLSDFVLIGMIASPIRDLILDFFEELWPAPLISNVSSCTIGTPGGSPGGNNPEGNPGGGKYSGDSNNLVEKPKQYVSTGPNTLIKEKEELLKLTGFGSPHVSGPLEQALLDTSKPNPKEYLYPDFSKAIYERDKETISVLEKVCEYFSAKDAGREPSVEAKNAFEKRKERYLGFAANVDSWKGPPVDFNDPSNVRKVAQEDLQKAKVDLDITESIINDKDLNKENFTGPDAKANFYKRLYEVFAEHRKKHLEFYKDEVKMEREQYDTYDEKTILWMLKSIRAQRKQMYQDAFKVWLEEKGNKDLLKKWSEEKINLDFIKEWLEDDKKT